MKRQAKHRIQRRAAKTQGRGDRTGLTVGTRRKKSTPGPKPSITLQVVKRVSERVGSGLTLELALAAEQVATINIETWKKALKAHPEFSPLYEGAKGKFLESAVLRLAGSNELQNLRWLLERRHWDLFARPRDDGIGASATSGGPAALPEDLVSRARQIAKAEKLKR